MSRTTFGLVQDTIPCISCNGKGKCVSPTDVCQDCNGKRILPTKKHLKVEVEKGTPDGHKYKFQKEGNEAIGYETGDVHVEIFLENKTLFERRGADLATTIEISLIEALTKFEIELTHLDGRKIYIKSKEGEIIQPGTVKTVYDAGMPFFTTPFKFGNLYISFNVIIPSLNQENKNDLLELFKEENELMKKQMNVIEEGNIKSRKVEMTQFDPKLQNTDEKGGKKIETKKNIDEDETNSNSAYNANFHQGRARGGRGVQYVQCGHQ